MEWGLSREISREIEAHIMTVFEHAFEIGEGFLRNRLQTKPGTHAMKAKKQQIPRRRS